MKVCQSELEDTTKEKKNVMRKTHEIQKNKEKKEV
jgi:hypothetical protein